LNLVGPYPVFVLQDASNPSQRGGRESGRRDLLASQVFRLLDAAVRTDEDAPVPEHPQGKDRQQGVFPEVVVRVRRHERVQADLGHFARLRPAEHVRIHIADRCERYQRPETVCETLMSFKFYFFVEEGLFNHTFSLHFVYVL